MLFLILTTLFGEAFSMTSRVVFCFMLAGITSFFPLLTHYVVTSESYGFYTILGVAAITGMTTATLQCTITGFCNYLPVKYIMVRFVHTLSFQALPRRPLGVYFPLSLSLSLCIIGIDCVRIWIASRGKASPGSWRECFVFW